MNTLILFYYLLFTGVIIPNDTNDGRQMYIFKQTEEIVFEYAYKEEIINCLNTGVFEYDEDL
jgi:hypothetical protein